MKILLHTGKFKEVEKSGVGRAIIHQKKALDLMHIPYTTDPNDDFDIAHFLQDHSANTTLIRCRFEVRTRQFVRVVKETDSKSVGLCPRKFESCSCRFFAPLFFSFHSYHVTFHFITLYHIPSPTNTP